MSFGCQDLVNKNILYIFRNIKEFSKSDKKDDWAFINLCSHLNNKNQMEKSYDEIVHSRHDNLGQSHKCVNIS